MELPTDVKAFITDYNQAGFNKDVMTIANLISDRFLHDGVTKLLIEGYGDSDMSKKLQGGVLLDKWGKWNNANNHRLDKIKEPSFSLISFIKGIISRNS